jgi:ATP-dependent DNA ligase
LASSYETLKPLEIESVRGDVEVGGAKPDVWFEPKTVWEVLTADLSLSPVYTAAHGLVSLCILFQLIHTLGYGRRRRANTGTGTSEELK